MLRASWISTQKKSTVTINEHPVNFTVMNGSFDSDITLLLNTSVNITSSLKKKCNPDLDSRNKS